MAGSNYHSALKGVGGQYSNPVERFCTQRCSAFTHDIRDGLPKEMHDTCDVIYTETAWKAGVEKFNKSAGVEQSWKEYVDGLSRAIKSTDKPFIVVTGKREANILPAPRHLGMVKFEGGMGQILYYNIRPFFNYGSNTEVWDFLMGRGFSCIGDPCCGYGNSGLYFYNRGLSCVMSDYNPNCIGYIADLIEKKIENEHLPKG